MSPEEIETKVKEIICEQLEVSAEQLRPESSFIDDLKADSLAVVELVLKFEQDFGITIPAQRFRQRRNRELIADFAQRPGRGATNHRAFVSAEDFHQGLYRNAVPRAA